MRHAVMLPLLPLLLTACPLYNPWMNSYQENGKTYVSTGNLSVKHTEPYIWNFNRCKEPDGSDCNQNPGDFIKDADYNRLVSYIKDAKICPAEFDLKPYRFHSKNVALLIIATEFGGDYDYEVICKE